MQSNHARGAKNCTNVLFVQVHSSIYFQNSLLLLRFNFWTAFFPVLFILYGFIRKVSIWYLVSTFAKLHDFAQHSSRPNLLLKFLVVLLKENYSVRSTRAAQVRAMCIEKSKFLGNFLCFQQGKSES